MASKFGTVWAVDIGNNTLKALRLSIESGAVEVIGFDSIEHSKILTGVGVTAAERDELIALSLHRFVEQNDVGKDEIIVSMPSQNSFARFVNLPPVESKRIPEIVKFEAAQQIPFDISEVQWDWQLMTEAGASETKVGIFAIKNDVIDAVLEHFNRENMTVSYVQMAPMALYNYVSHDRNDWGSAEHQATVVLDIGAENTDLVVCTKETVWQRCVPMGGNAFTRAIADAFRLNFQRAEKLKRTAPMSKYARQIFQAMRPVFTDLASEIQRSLNFYSSSNPETKLHKVIALGGGTKMRGLLKYLRQTLQVPVERPDSFEKLAMGPGVSPAKFHEKVPDFGIVYGLALQGLGLARIESNLLPRSVGRSIAWAGKAKYFTAAASMFLLVSLMAFARTSLDTVNYSKNDYYREKAAGVTDAVRKANKNLEQQESRAARYEAAIKKAWKRFECRDVVPMLYQTIIDALPNEKNNPQQAELYRAFAYADAGVDTVKKTQRKERKQVFITGMTVRFVDDVETAELGAVGLVKSAIWKGKKDDEIDERGLAELELFQKRSMFRPKQYAPLAQKAEANRAGFVVTVEGYSPYKNLGELMDPERVDGQPLDRWGVITRLLHLDDIFDGNSPFELYKKTDPKHFKLQPGVVEVGAEMPSGIDVAEVEKPKDDLGGSSERILIDPMTKEPISKIAKPNGEYEINDRWFVLKMKFLWRNAPKAAGPATQPVRRY